MKVVYFPSMCHIFQISLGRQGHSLLNGEKVIAIIPTGRGKTVVYVLPCIMKPGLAVVISPLMMLICDQVARLQGYGINTCYYNTLLSDCER